MGALENIIKCLNKQNIHTTYKFPKAGFRQLVEKWHNTKTIAVLSRNNRHIECHILQK